MRVNISSLLGQKGGFLAIEEEIPSEFVESSPPVLEVKGPIRANLTVTNTGEGFLVAGQLQLKALLRCSRCLKPFAAQLEAPVEEKFSQRAAPAEEAEWDWDAPPALDGRELDLTSVIEETLLVNIPMKTLCREDCPGLCSTCGADLAGGSCGCPSPDTDVRLAPLGKLLQTLPESRERRKEDGCTKKKTIESEG